MTTCAYCGKPIETGKCLCMVCGKEAQVCDCKIEVRDNTGAIVKELIV